jgi:hypothetical protein
MRTSCAVIGAIAAVFGAGTSTASAAQGNSDGFAVRVLSNRADLISDGQALVGLALPRHKSLSDAEATLANDSGEQSVNGIFHELPSGRNQGLLEDLELGKNVLTVTLPNGRSRSVVITNHPNGGPVFSGPQVGPWQCQDGALDDKCNQPATYEFLYKSTSPVPPGLQPYDPENPPSDVATTTTDQGVEAPFIVRVETGYQARDQYKVAALYQPDLPWEPWDPQPQWNHKVLITHGASCGVTYGAGDAPAVTDETALGRGFAVMSTALDNAGHNCNIATQAESLVMAKERIVEQFGQIRYTIGTGCSGGSLTQQQVANAYPGVYQGILPACSFPDALSTGIQFADYHGLRTYFEDVATRLPQLWLPAQWGPVQGHLSGVNAVAADELFFKTATAPGGTCVPADVVYDAETNPGGVRCSILDYMINIFGPRPESVWSPMEQAAGKGFAGFPLGNVGVQYGLGALDSGLITTEQFVDLNHEIGGLDIDVNHTTERTPGDVQTIKNTYRSGAINSANNMDQVAIIDLRGPDPGAAHDAYRSWEVRARLDREHGTHENQVIWFGPVPLLGDPNFATDGLIAMDEWLAAVEADKSSKPLAQKIIDDKPGDLQDECEPTGLIVGADCELITGPSRYGTPRTVAGDAITTDNAACQLKPLVREDYSVTFTDEQWTRMEEAFPTGVCDFSKDGIGQQDTIPWQTYQKGDGSVIYGGKTLGASPTGSGAGWTSKAFGSWRKAEKG